MEPEEVRKCIICRQNLKKTEGDACHNCSSKYHFDEEAPKVGKIHRKKKREEQ